MDNGRIAETQPVKDQESTYFEIILCLFYIICKLNQLWAMFKELMISFLEMKNGMVNEFHFEFRLNNFL